MVKKLTLTALMLGASIQVVSAQVIQDGFVRPPDMPEYIPVIPEYAVGTDAPYVMTPGVDPDPPAYATELPASETPANTGWVVPSGGDACLTVIDGGSCTEAKFRFHTRVTHVLADDPVRNWGQPGTSHWHMFFGNQTVNAYSTFESLRTFDSKMRGSASSGGPMNGTGYWMPPFIVEIDGQDYGIPPGEITGYYQENPLLSAVIYTVPVGGRYVLGYNMDDADFMPDIVTAANTAAGWSRYRLHQSTAHDEPVWHSYGCGGETSIVFKNADNSDPFNGECTAGELIQLSFEGPRCWDLTNPWSPGGYKHIIPTIWDTHTSTNVCPNNYGRIAALQLNMSWLSPGFSGERGYGNWSLASDAHAGTLPGYSFHTDWMDGWKTSIRRAWERDCIGSGYLGGTPHECNNSAIGDDDRLIVGENAPDGSRSPQVPFDGHGDVNDLTTLFKLPASSSGPVDVPVHH